LPGGVLEERLWSKLFGASIGRGAQRIISAMVRWLAYGHINPNALTVIGVGINVLSGVLFGYGYFFWAGVILIVANLFDMLDGQVARLSGRVTRFGGFLDSSLDRLSDMVVFVGLMVFYARDTEFHSTLNVFLAGAAMMGSVMVSYASARAESLIEKCDVGFLRRPERVVLLIIGGLSTHPGSANYFANRMPAVLWILAVGSYWTFAHRMYHTWREVWRADLATAAQAAKDASKTGRAGAGGEPAKENSPAAKIANEASASH
ncbi:MAG: CDP-diacylglycerol---glycerol-3-phosphate 3-phosphatidyltransferase, partial [Acidobacteriota bacterium]|nr:CDP-diacylglycerol---glycerol-3-phosphate 3-phosphatidyltransferase [Acidobacteriota bacterium]